MAPEEEVRPSISFPVDDIKLTVSLVETLHGIRTDVATGLGRLEKSLENKASKNDVERVVTKLEGHDRRISTLERDKELREERAKVHEQRDQRARLSRKARVGLIIGGATLVSTVTYTIVSIVALGH